ncbi:hypothetical protein [Actinokineospora xionganensis]
MAHGYSKRAGRIVLTVVLGATLVGGAAAADPAESAGQPVVGQPRARG